MSQLIDTGIANFHCFSSAELKYLVNKAEKCWKTLPMWGLERGSGVSGGRGKKRKNQVWFVVFQSTTPMSKIWNKMWNSLVNYKNQKNKKNHKNSFERLVKSVKWEIILRGIRQKL